MTACTDGPGASDRALPHTCWSSSSRSILHSVDKFCASERRITANHLALIRSFLINSAGQRGLHNAGCAKKFCHSNTRAANCVSVNCNARGAKFVLQKRALWKLPSLQKALFHRMFFNFSNARAKVRSVSLLRAINFNFDRATMQKRVVSRAHTRFVRR